jgi:ketosteroid isomerase-like protein
MGEEEKIELTERICAAWNRGDLDALLEECTPDFEYDLTRSGIPGLTEVFRGPEEYLRFASTWRETMGSTRLRLDEARELEGGRLFVVMYQAATGPQSGAGIEEPFVQILEFDGGRCSRAELFGDPAKGRAAAGVD